MAADRNKVRWISAASLAALALVNFGAAAYNWFYGGATWYFLGLIKVRLHQWERPWLYGLILFGLAVLIRPGSFIPPAFFRALFDPWRHRGPSFTRPWLVAGAVAGLGVGLYISHAWHYLFPSLLSTLPLMLACAFILAAGGLAAATIVNRAFSSRDDRARHGLVIGAVEFLLLLLVRWPLPQWDGRFTEPPMPLLTGFAIGLALAWAFGLIERRGLLANRRPALAAGLAVALVAAMAISHLAYRGRVNAAAPRDRVIFVSLDTTRADHLSSYGYHRPTTPNIDAIAAAGARFGFTICPMGITDPSHASMFTGAYPRTHGLLQVVRPMTGKVASLPEYFAERGYATAAITSRWHLRPSDSLNLPGFDFESEVRTPGFETSAASAFRRAANWLSDHRDQDSFIWVHFFDPHDPYLPHRGRNQFARQDARCECKGLLKKDRRYTDEELRDCVDLYDGEIEYTDYWVGRLVEYVENLEPKSERPPLIVIVADHGEIMGEYQDRLLHGEVSAPGRFGFGHGDLLARELAWIPMIIRWPGQIRPTTVGGVAEIVDLAPTLVDYVFGEANFPAQGRSLRPAIEGKTPDQVGVIERMQREGHAEFYVNEPRYALFRGTDKLTVLDNGSRSLYDTAWDLRENADLSLALPATADELGTLFDNWLRAVPYTPPAKVSLDASQQSILKALGYIQ